MGQHRYAHIYAFGLCTVILLLSSVYPCGNYIEERPFLSSFVYFLVLMFLGILSVWLNKKQACLLLPLHLYTLFAAVVLVFATSNACPFVFSNPSMRDISLSTLIDAPKNAKNYYGGNFHFVDGHIVRDLMVKVSRRGPPWYFAPVVPALERWNRTRDPVPAWAISVDVRFYPSSFGQWQDPNLREGYLFNSDQVREAGIREMAQKNNLITSDKTPIIQWRDVDETFMYAVLYLTIANGLVYPIFVAICAATVYLKKKFRHPSQKKAATEVYLLTDLRADPWYGGSRTDNNNNNNNNDKP